MTNQDTIQPTLAAHGAARLPAVEVEDYNVELKDEEGSTWLYPGFNETLSNQPYFAVYKRMT